MSRPVFVSYGHKDASEFVLRLKRDLEDRGIEPVWLDSDRIAAGQAWTTAIERGIRDSEVVLALMTEHSVREESICQDEVALARTEGKRVLPVRVEPDVPPTLLLVRHSWVDFTDDYDAAFERLIQALNGDPSGLTSPLASVAGQRPLDFGVDLARHGEHFTGRQWLFHDLDEWLANNTGGACLILGEPGIGKSAIAAQLARRPDCATVHFCSAGNGDSQDPLAFVANLVASLAARVPGFGAAVAERHPEQIRDDAVTAFRHLVVDPGRSMPAPESQQLIVIDALDEAALIDGKTIVHLLAEHADQLPPWLRIVATSRPESKIVSLLRQLNVRTLQADRPENLEDLRSYVREALATRPDAIDLVIERSAGNFLVARRYCSALQDGTLTLERLAELPAGLASWYAKEFDDLEPDPDRFEETWAPLLRLVVAAAAPLPFALLCKATGWSESTTNKRLLALASFLTVRGARSDETYAPFHRSLTDWLTDRDAAGDYWCSPAEGARALVAALEATEPGTPAADYALRWRVRHLLEIGQVTQARTLLEDAGFISEKIEEGLLSSLQDDLALVAAKTRAPDRYLTDLEIVLRQNAHLLTPLEPRGSLTATLASRMGNRPELSKLAAALGDHSGPVYLRPIQPLTDLPHPALLRVFRTYHHATAVSPDGTWLAAGSADGTLRIWDPITGREVHTLADQTEPLTAVAFAPDGTWLAGGNRDGSVQIWDPASGDQRHVLRGHTNRITTIVIASDCTWLATAGYDEAVQIWDPVSGQHRRTLPEHTKLTTAIAIAPNGTWLATSAAGRLVRPGPGIGDLLDRGRIRIWDAHSGDLLHVLPGRRGSTGSAATVTALAIAPDMKWLAAGDNNGKVSVWDSASGQRKHLLEFHAISSVTTLAITPDGDRLVTGGQNGIVQIWNPHTGERYHTLSGHTHCLTTLAVAPTGTWFASAGRGGAVRIWDTRTGHECDVLTGHTDEVAALDITPDSTRLATTSKDGAVRIWSPRTGSHLRERSRLNEWVALLQAAPDSTWCVTARVDGTIQTWDLHNGRQRHLLAGHTQKRITALAIAPDSTWLATSDWFTIYIWDSATGKQRSTITRVDPITAMAIAPDSTWLATGYRDGTVKIWEPTTGAQHHTLTGPSDRVTALAVASDGTWLAVAASRYSPVRIWDTHTGMQRHTLWHIDEVTALAISPDSTWLAIGYQDGIVRIWDALTGIRRHTLSGHTKMISAIAIAPDGTWLTACSDTGVLIWDSLTGEQRRTLTGDTSGVTALTITPDGASLTTAGPDHTVKIWNPLTGASVAALRFDTPISHIAASGGRTIITAGSHVFLLEPVIRQS